MLWKLECGGAASHRSCAGKGVRRIGNSKSKEQSQKGVASPRNHQRTSWPEPANKRGQVSRFQDHWRRGHHSDGCHEELGFYPKGNGELFAKRYK